MLLVTFLKQAGQASAHLSTNRLYIFFVMNNCGTAENMTEWVTDTDSPMNLLALRKSNHLRPDFTMKELLHDSTTHFYKIPNSGLNIVKPPIHKKKKKKKKKQFFGKKENRENKECCWIDGFCVSVCSLFARFSYCSKTRTGPIQWQTFSTIGCFHTRSCKLLHQGKMEFRGNMRKPSGTIRVYLS